MITYCVDCDSVAVILRRQELPFIRQAIKNCLESRGLLTWEHIEGELFALDDSLLLIARPLSPLCAPKSPPRLRLKRG